MKKICLLLATISFFGMHGAARSSKRSSVVTPSFTPAEVVITAIVNYAHNPISVIHANGEDGAAVSFTVSAGGSSVDESLSLNPLYTVLAYDDQKSLGLPNLKSFHVRSEHALYVFANRNDGVAAYTVSSDGKKFEKRKPLLAPWPKKREVELAIGHDGKMELRIPGCISKAIRNKKSKAMKGEKSLIESASIR